MNTFPGFGLAGYRSFGSKIQRIGALGKMSLLAGANNSGKSNVLRFATDHLQAVIEKLKRGQPYTLSGLDRPNEGEPSQFRFSVAAPTDDHSLEQWAEEIAKGRQSQVRPTGIQAFLQQLLSLDEFGPAANVAWLDINPAARDRQAFFESTLISKLSETNARGRTTYGPTSEQWRDFWNITCNRTGGDLRSNWVPESLAKILERCLFVPKVLLVPAYRQIENATEDVMDDLSGRGLIKRLAQLERPSITDQHKKAKFNAIQSFVREVTNVPDAMLEVPYERDTLHVHLDGRMLPISNLGTGIHQVVMLAAAATLHDECLMCLEEPELHLHPILQKALIRYLGAKTTNQYLVSTHSASFLDAEGASVFRVRLDTGKTQVELAKSPDDHFEICSHLGYHASDLLQCNAVVWVEGPSDRIYVLEWLRKIAPELKEGLHFSVMFYGGSLLKHVSADVEPAAEFAKLRRLNRSFAVIMDGDRKTAGAALGAAKERIIAELTSQRCFAWALDCRTIENFLPLGAWKRIVGEVHPRSAALWNGNRFHDPFSGLPEVPNKVELAKRARDYDLVDVRLPDLAEGIGKLAQLIREANPPAQALS